MFTERKHDNRAKTPLLSEKVPPKAKIHLTSENVARKVEKAFTERICLEKEKLSN